MLVVVVFFPFLTLKLSQTEKSSSYVLVICMYELFSVVLEPITDIIRVIHIPVIAGLYIDILNLLLTYR